MLCYTRIRVTLTLKCLFFICESVNKDISTSRLHVFLYSITLNIGLLNIFPAVADNTICLYLYYRLHLL